MYGLWLFKQLKTEYGYCKIEIFKKSYSGSPIEIEAVEANSLTLSIENLSETISPIGKSVCSFSIVDTGQLSYDDFFTPDATGIKVVISTINEDRGDVAYTTRWSGFVTPDFYSESLVYRTAINISARDNIGYLSDVEFDLVEPTIQIRELFSKAFVKISNDYPMQIMIHSHKATEGDFLLADAIINTTLFRGKTWGEALEVVLHDLGLQMRWVDNNTIAVIDLSQIPEYYLPTQFQFINSSGYREILPAWRSLTQEQDYGVRDNFFDGWITDDQLVYVRTTEFASIINPITVTGQETTVKPIVNVDYYKPTNWSFTTDVYTFKSSDFRNVTHADKISFSAIRDETDFLNNYISYKIPIYQTFSPLTIKGKAFNSIVGPTKFNLPTISYPNNYWRECTLYKGPVNSTIPSENNSFQLGLKFNVYLHAEGGETYILMENWEDLRRVEDPNFVIDFKLPKLEREGDARSAVPREVDIKINIAGIPYNGELELRIYGYYFVERDLDWNFGIGWKDCFTYIKNLTYTFNSDNIEHSQSAQIGINPLHNIERNEKFVLGEIVAERGGLNAYAGGLFHPITFGSLNRFKRNEDSPAYNLLELVGREIIHFNKKNYNKLSGEIKSPTKEPLKFNSLFSRDGKLYYPFSCSLNVIDNTMTITSMQEVEPYITESFTEIHSEVKSDGGTTVSGGNNTVLQYSEDAGNAKRLYEMQDATPAEKEKAFALVDSPDFPQARRIRVADLIGLDEPALAQYLELKKYVQEDDLIPLATSISTLATYFTNGSANNALKLGGIDAGNYWHKGNSGTLDYNWKAKKLNVRTLVIPTSEPTDLSQGEVGFYLGTAGQGAEEPNGSGGLDLTELWAELSSEDYAKKIHISHIPTIQYSSIAGRPSALVNPYALTINGVRYDGSEPISLDISAGGGVADSVAWGNVFNKPSTISGYGITDAYTKDSVDLKLSNYLPKSGGTINGTLTVSSEYNFAITNNATGAWSGVRFRIAGANKGYLGVDSAGKPIYVPYDQSAIYTLIHSGNIGSQSVNYATTAGSAKASDVYAWAKAATKPTYTASEVGALSTSGGTITHQNYGAFELKRNYSNYGSVIKFSNTSDGLLGYIGISGSATTQAPKSPYYSPNEDAVYPLIHTGNYANYALPLSGGTITGALKLGTKGELWYGSNSEPYLKNTTTGNYINVGISGLYWNNTNIFIHSGNIGSYALKNIGSASVDSARGAFGYDNSSQGSVDLPNVGGFISVGIDKYGFQLLGEPRNQGLYYRGLYNNELNDWKTIAFTDSNVASADYATTAGSADTLDGYHHDSFVKSYLDSTDNFTKFTDRAFFQTAWISGQGDFGSLVIPTWLGNNTNAYYTTELRFNNGSTKPKIRVTDPNGTSDWYTLARTVDNVASATKLQTARTIWGQSFDGTGNVSGSLAGVANISMSGLISGFSYLYNNSTNGFLLGSRDVLGGSAGGAVVYTYGDTPIDFYTGNALRMHIHYNGNVLIGKTTDNGSKLQVNGAMEATELVIPTAPPTNPQPGKHYLYLA